MRQLQQPRLAEIVAARLREDVLAGRLKEGDVLGNQEQLLRKYRVSLPALREAMRILETDGLVAVRRGNVGGAVVHAPSPRRAAEMIAMVLQSRATPPSQVSTALRFIEPVCAGLCAGREDRAHAVVPILRTILEMQRENVHDPVAYLRHSGDFHANIVSLCGNEPMIVVVGALETIWSAHESMVWKRVAEAGPTDTDPEAPLSRSTINASLRAHERLTTEIENGNVERAGRLAAQHLNAVHVTTLSSSEHESVLARLVNEVDLESADDATDVR